MTPKMNVFNGLNHVQIMLNETTVKNFEDMKWQIKRDIAKIQSWEPLILDSKIMTFLLHILFLYRCKFGKVTYVDDPDEV